MALRILSQPLANSWGQYHKTYYGRNLQFPYLARVFVPCKPFQPSNQLWYFILSVNTHFNGLLNPDPPLKSTAPFGAKITRADSTLETAPPPVFPDPVSRSRSDYLLYYLRTCKMKIKLLRNLTPFRQHILLLYSLVLREKHSSLLWKP